MKEVKRLSDEVLLYKSWEESPSGHVEESYWIKIIPDNTHDIIFEEGKETAKFIPPSSNKKDIKQYKISLKTLMDFIRENGQLITK